MQAQAVRLFARLRTSAADARTLRGAVLNLRQSFTGGLWVRHLVDLGLLAMIGLIVVRRDERRLEEMSRQSVFDVMRNRLGTSPGLVVLFGGAVSTVVICAAEVGLSYCN